MPRLVVRSALPLLLLALAACHGQQPSTTTTATGTDDNATDTPLPKPAPASGPVTGMPSKPGPGPVGPPTNAGDEDTALASDEAGVQGDAAGAPAGDATTGTPTAADAAAIATEPSVEDAADVVRGYYAALVAHDPARAHAYWAQGMRPVAEPGAEPDTTGLAVDVGTPGRMDAAAGSRYVRVPVTLTRTLRDGSTVRSAMTVTLRRSVVDGATPEQRAWRITAADAAAAPAPSP